MDAALSANVELVSCPWCGSERGEYRPAARSNSLPSFQCRGCQAEFTRVSNTPLVDATIRERAWRLVPTLGWQDDGQEAARKLGVSVPTLHAWVRVWRQWLLVLDPSGAMEARVSLGLSHAEGTETEEWKAVQGDRQSSKSEFNMFQQGRKRVAIRMPGFTATRTTQQMSTPPETVDTHPLDALFAWRRLRARKRDQWALRNWKKNAAGESFLNADGYMTRIIKAETATAAWCFELRAKRTVEVIRSNGGYRSIAEARLAAFDAITELLLRQ